MRRNRPELIGRKDKGTSDWQSVSACRSEGSRRRSLGIVAASRGWGSVAGLMRRLKRQTLGAQVAPGALVEAEGVVGGAEVRLDLAQDCVHLDEVGQVTRLACVHDDGQVWRPASPTPAYQGNSPEAIWLPGLRWALAQAVIALRVNPVRGVDLAGTD